VLTCAVAPWSFASAFAMSTSAPTALPCWSDSIGGYVVSLQKTIVFAADAATADAATTAAAAETAVRVAAMMRIGLIVFLSETPAGGRDGPDRRNRRRRR